MGEDINASRFLAINKALPLEAFKSTFYGYIECYNDYKKTKEDILQEAIFQSKYRDIGDVFPKF